MSKFILKHIDSNDIWDNKIYYAFKFVIGSSYNINIRNNPINIYTVQSKDSGNGYYRFNEIDKGGNPTGRVLFNSGSIISPYVDSWRNRYGWWVCETYEEAVETRENLINLVVSTLEQKIKKLEGLKEIIKTNDNK